MATWFIVLLAWRPWSFAVGTNAPNSLTPALFKGTLAGTFSADGLVKTGSPVNGRWVCMLVSGDAHLLLILVANQRGLFLIMFCPTGVGRGSLIYIVQYIPRCNAES